MKSPFLALLLALAIPATSLAAPRVLSERQLSEGTLLGPVQSTQQLQRAFRQQSPLLERASARLGLSHADFIAVRQEIELGRVRYVNLPRHLNGMAGESSGVAFADWNVIIPSDVYGWEVDLQKPDGLVRVFVPNRCGNISYLIVPHHFRVAAAQLTPPPQPVPTPNPTPAPVAITTSVPVAVVPPAAPAAAAAGHAFGWWPLLLVPVLFAIPHGGGGNSTPPHMIVPTPTPTPVSCTSVVRSHAHTFAIRFSIPIP